MKISVFGGSQAREGTQAYEEAMSLGELLARSGHTVLTGGYMGMMEAVSRGAASAGGHVIGVTCDEIERWHGRAANAWVTEERKRATLLERLETLIRDAEAAVALPGGPGTLTEVALMWNLMIVGSLEPRSLVLLGDEWKAVFDTFVLRLGAFIPERQRSMLQFASTPVEALDKLQIASA
jgi:hypothetical protein